MSRRSKSLGKGLSALLPEKPLYNKVQEDIVKLLDIKLVYPNKNQPRTGFNEEKLEELSNSIKENGIIQPIVVTRRDNKFMIVAGERRFKAAQKAEIEKIPAIIKDVTDSKILELALIENIQREDLLPIEESRALSKLSENSNLNNTELAKRIGKSRSYVSNMIRLLNLPEYVQILLENNALSMGHARALLGLDDVEKIEELADKIVANELNVRQVENIIKNLTKQEEKPKIQEEHVTSLIIRELEASLESDLKTKVEIKDKGEKGKIVIEYYSNQDLERLVSRIRQEKE